MRFFCRLCQGIFPEGLEKEYVKEVGEVYLCDNCKLKVKVGESIIENGN